MTKLNLTELATVPLGKMNTFPQVRIWSLVKNSSSILYAYAYAYAYA